MDGGGGGGVGEQEQDEVGFFLCRRFFTSIIMVTCYNTAQNHFDHHYDCITMPQMEFKYHADAILMADY
jgi:hypothetical protein